MKKLIGSLAVLPLLTVGVVAGSGSAQAAVLTPPPPNSTAAFSPITLVGGAGINVKFRPATVCSDQTTFPGGFTGLCNPSGGIQGGPGAPGVPEVALFDFLPPPPISVGAPGTGYGQFKVDNSQPLPSNVFTNAQSGAVKDVVLPYLGPGLLIGPPFPIALDIPAFLSFDGDATPPTGPYAPGSADTFDATEISSIVFITTVPGSAALAQFSFNGFYNILNPVTGLVERYMGTANLSQPISGTDVAGVLAAGRSAGGFATSYSGQTSVKHTPEPATLAGLAAFAGAAALLKKRRKQQ